MNWQLSLVMTFWQFSLTTTNRYHHTRGFPPIAAPPWLYNLYHQSILIVPLIFSTIFAQPFASYSSVTTIFGSFHLLAHRDTSPPLLLHPMLFSINFLNKNYHPLVFTPAKTIQTIISFRRRSLFLLPTTPLPPSGSHRPVPTSPPSTHMTYQFLCVKQLLLRFKCLPSNLLLRTLGHMTSEIFLILPQILGNYPQQIILCLKYFFSTLLGALGHMTPQKFFLPSTIRPNFNT